MTRTASTEIVCGIGTARQVDDHLPKSRYPYLAVVSVDMLPVCSDCNFPKNDQVQRSDVEQTLLTRPSTTSRAHAGCARFVVNGPSVVGPEQLLDAWRHTHP